MNQVRLLALPALPAWFHLLFSLPTYALLPAFPPATSTYTSNLPTAAPPLSHTQLSSVHSCAPTRLSAVSCISSHPDSPLCCARHSSGCPTNSTRYLGNDAISLSQHKTLAVEWRRGRNARVPSVVDIDTVGGPNTLRYAPARRLIPGPGGPETIHPYPVHSPPRRPSPVLRPSDAAPLEESVSLALMEAHQAQLPRQST